MRVGAAQAARHIRTERRDDSLNRFTVRRLRSDSVGRVQLNRVFIDVILMARLGKGFQHWGSCAHEVSVRWTAQELK